MRGYFFISFWDLNSKRETEVRNRQEESPDTAASARNTETAGKTMRA